MPDGLLRITKFDAMQRQLDSAIEMWFSDRDPVAVHTLLLASHEILHTLLQRKGPRHLLFDSVVIRKEMKQEWNKRITKWYDFLKHAEHDYDSSISFNPSINEFIIIHSIQGLREMKTPLTFFEEAFSQWFLIHRTQFLPQSLRHGVEIMDITDLRALPKQEFLQDFYRAWNIAQRPSGR